jgi:hypothetical protein
VLPLIEQCPSCSGALEVRELYCASCDIEIRGHFQPAAPSRFSQLNDEQVAFLELFVLSRGNLSDVERSLGVSYPTVRAKLDDLIGAMSENQAAPVPPAPTLSRAEILARVADGRLTTDDGMRMLQQLGSEG